jgi:hypothetical protein
VNPKVDPGVPGQSDGTGSNPQAIPAELIPMVTPAWGDDVYDPRADHERFPMPEELPIEKNSLDEDRTPASGHDD